MGEHVNAATKTFLAQLEKEPRVLGVILFGSWARGTNRPDSDVDLVVLVQEGYRRTIERIGQQVFEVIYVTEDAAFQFWKNHPDECAGVWEVAKILPDRDGTVARLEQRARRIVQGGKRAIDQDELKQRRFDAEDQIAYAERIAVSDPATARLVLANKVFELTATYFDVRGRWTPGPKVRVATIRASDREVYEALEEFYGDTAPLSARISAARRLVEAVFASG